MNKHINTLFFILILMCTNVMYIYKYCDTKKQSIREINIYRENNKTMRNLLNNIFSTKIEYDNLKIDSIQIFNNNKIIKWDEINNKISLIIPEKSCNLCYDEIYDAIKQINSIHNIKISVITSVNKYKELKNTFSELEIKSNLLYYKGDCFSNINISNTPYFIFIDKEMVGKQMFIPFTTHTSLTKLYLEKMIERYYINKSNE